MMDPCLQVSLFFPMNVSTKRIVTPQKNQRVVWGGFVGGGGGGGVKPPKIAHPVCFPFLVSS